MRASFRLERDSMGEIKVPADALWGAQTQRAVQNFPISGLAMPRPFISALGLVKQAAARANRELKLLEPKVAQAVEEAAAEVAAGVHDEQFPIDVFQTGSGTSSNMNANEVIAALASRRLGSAVHPNDHVNMCQSSNDVIPTAIHVSAALTVRRELSPALEHLAEVLSIFMDGIWVRKAVDGGFPERADALRMIRQMLDMHLDAPPDGKRPSKRRATLESGASRHRARSSRNRHVSRSGPVGHPWSRRPRCRG